VLNKKQTNISAIKMKGRVLIIKNKKLLILSGILLIFSIALTFPYPDAYLSARARSSIFNVPVTTMDGLNIMGIVALLLLLVSLILLVKGLEKYKKRLVFATILLFMLLPIVLISFYQKTLAADVYAISYEIGSSECNFTKNYGENLNGSCEFTFTNHSRDAVLFAIEFYDQYWYEESVRTVSLMNNNAPYMVELKGDETKRVKIESSIEESGIEHQFYSANSTQVNIIIRSEKGERRL
jgi:hypothetical protein